MRGLAMAALAALATTGCGLTRGIERDALVAETSPCAPQRFEVYFAEGEARLTNPALQALGLTATRLQGCAIRRVQVLGLADPSGAPEANLDLSERRAVAVREALTAAGWPAPAFELGAGGESGALAASGAVQPMRRRTEVLVDAAPL
ncbi:OmpA family protein [Brevundimonas sp.]|uniref:OmpA family protein n=1 Tax=Brevundimonas sp. TaxID=1871086 RepID=UPI0025BBE5AF|nr:OmpA family protein [Brevundimonas sp.]